ncbi:atlastin-1 isoform X2 [Rhipicephalus sanguineus]|uniref:atlastin-1 isoform X2 n=1 Tax=Rhipicephalus sanguineus TaxID=34632 RepID=UPI0020C21D68|nr:atlastin-1 isoform X2 [Rhipicephalus sanguineus]
MLQVNLGLRSTSLPYFGKGAVMSDRVDSGQPLNILNVDGRSLELDEHGLARLLLDERVKDKPVVVIAVAGAFRKGKSFLLCFLIRYLRSEGRAEWLGDPNAPLEGFGWRGGSERHTTGILMWNEVFLVKTSQGNELAVLLMDTQGTFDCESASVVHASIFALSAMISSVLVYNVSQNIQQNDLQHLKDFIEYGMMTMSEQQQQQQPTTAEVGSTRPFQSLMFLVRDWQFEMPYGLAGGQQLLEKRLKGPPNQDRELRQLRRKLSKCFRKMHCFLMPHPGLTVAQEGFDGRLSDIGETFKLHLSEFVRLLLEPDNLQPKKINGREITCLELLSYIKATHAGSCRAAMDKSLDFYTTSMLSLWQNSPDDDADRETMRRYHNELRKVAVEQYSAAPKMGGELPAQLYLHKLKEKMDVTFDVYCEYLKEKKKTFVNAAVFKHVAFKVAHGFLTTGLAAAAIALAVVELPVVAIALGAFGAASLSGHLVQVIVEMELAKRKRKERHENSKAAAEAAKRRGFGGADIEEFDDEVPLFAAEDDTGSVLSLELAESAATSPEPPVTVTDGAETTRGNRSSTAAGASNGRDGSDDCIPLLHASDDTDSVQSADFPDFERVSLGPSVMVCDDTAATEATNAMAFARAIKHYSDGMQQVCGDSIPRLSEEDLQKYHDLLQVYAHEILMRGCSSAGKRVLPHFVDRLTNEIEEQLKNFVNQNREKTTVMT